MDMALTGLQEIERAGAAGFFSAMVYLLRMLQPRFFFE
jgi:hypothetical protein